ncbi:DNA-binding transcriptional regulator FabR [Mergibacter septicus]|uniref:DNA-binding transcriptional regulator FabR n=1 Tax=Mergibacter septicus TaxID=221402 RepID=A0A8E3MDH5_9PAST|nr:HTH-type transcriptional repressor FabR [Mergibacter septicus]AWX15826.1 DNA-binding transcriptional regulator FabR [Mergibacter septicus]QDJ13305.1 DNA-binding transcriptional regulator FabR [Mergibacter septicus]QDJ15079.1 DNA-binding transcriptional regulator FabR [Mergibacter septicus]UTU47497.1 HTH-type transcriptional repressor FabR [Mergibacter septicus]WMR95322.1 HTH-type transcriptional repressor FabR [Mergibacter septicus]
MSGIRAKQKEKTRRALIDAAFDHLSVDKCFSNLSLREVAREAGIAPTSFYRHFRDLDELGLSLVDEAGLILRQLMRQARQRIEYGGSVIAISVETFFEFIHQRPNVFRLLLRESSGTSAAFRTAISREIAHFVAELSEYIQVRVKNDSELAYVQAEAMVTLVFASGSLALDMSLKEREHLKQRLILQLRMIAKGALLCNNEKIVKDQHP